jgi:hypothetical protein
MKSVLLFCTISALANEMSSTDDSMRKRILDETNVDSTTAVTDPAADSATDSAADSPTDTPTSTGSSSDRSTDTTDTTVTSETPTEDSTTDTTVEESTFIDTTIAYFYEKVPDVDTCFRYIRDDPSPLKEFNSICHNRVSDILYCCSPEPSPPDAFYFDDDGFKIAEVEYEDLRT